MLGTARVSGRVSDAELEASAVMRVPALLSITTTARLLGCSTRTVRRRIAEQSLPAVIEHGRLMVRGDELRAYIDSLERVGSPASRRRRAGRSYDFDFLRK
jgi:excisionase family DNA binding protein